MILDEVINVRRKRRPREGGTETAARRAECSSPARRRGSPGPEGAVIAEHNISLEFVSRRGGLVSGLHDRYLPLVMVLM
jgi:hypothetical protein